VVSQRLDKNPSEGARPARRALNVLVADDERDTVLTLLAVLRDEGHSARGVYRGDEVLRAVETEMPDAVILDIEMPGKSGFAIAQELRHLYGDETPLLIAISGKWTGQTDEMLGRMVGFKHYCLKPCDPQKLLELLEPLQGA
jgi:two-component system, OmpR family, response regulator